MDDLSSARLHRELLGVALARVLIKAGIIDPDQSYTGPQLLLAADGYCGRGPDGKPPEGGDFPVEWPDQNPPRFSTLHSFEHLARDGRPPYDATVDAIAGEC